MKRKMIRAFGVLVLAGFCLLCFADKQSNTYQAGGAGKIKWWQQSNSDDGLFAYYTRLPFSDEHTGKFADIVVRLDKPEGEIIFGRETSYLPVWKTEKGSWPFEEVVERKGDGEGVRPDALNKYSYARVIENSSRRVVVHWRYMEDFDNVQPDGVVHEYFTIKPSGKVTRSIRKGTKKYDDWVDASNRAIQKLKLKEDGIEEVSFSDAEPQRSAGELIKGNPVKQSVPGTPDAWWKFDEGLKGRAYEDKFKTKESISGNVCAISGHKAIWKAGVSGSALGFDGYNSKVTLPASQAPVVSSALTLDLWFALGAYPFNDAAFIQQFNNEDAGYYLGVNTYGHIVFKLAVDSKMHQLILEDEMPRYRWTHIVGTYEKESSKMRLFVNGDEKAVLSVGGSGITMNESDVIIGSNSAKKKATDLVRPENNIPQIFGVEGLIDEVKIYNTALSSAEVSKSYNKFMPGEEVTGNPDLERRIMPGEVGDSEKFGGYYTKLGYHDLWDTMWRTSENSDIVVKFDDMPTSVIYWHGTCYGMGWVTENNKWMSDQSAEIGGPYGCAEHMADKQQRHTYVRLIENTPARVVVHWRYSAADIGYNFDNDRAWCDEYHTIYPDGVTLRKINFHAGRPGWHEPQLFSQAGTSPLDNISIKAMSVANLDGEVSELDFSDGPPENPLEDGCIELYNLKSKYKVFGIFPDETRLVTTGWFNTEQSPHTSDPFAGPWNHWPVSQLLSDGRLITAHDRMTSCALGEREGVTEQNIGMYGFTSQSVSTLVPLGRSWNYPAEVSEVSGCTMAIYDKEQRAYELAAKSSDISFTVAGSENSPVVNPCFVIHNWGSNAEAAVKVNGKRMANGKELRQGIIRDTKGKRALVVWFETESEKLMQVSISKI